VRAVVQRVTQAAVHAGDEVVGQIGLGLLALVAAHQRDTPADATWMAEKLAHLRIFEDGAGKMNLGLRDVGGAALVISQFTLYGDARKGRRPNFMAAARPELAEPLLEQVVQGLHDYGIRTATGRFGAHMQVALVNDGPVTIVLESPSTSGASGGPTGPEG
jgi:D-tyrosyl-tRNA(Tyr) deacylase